MKGFSFGLSVGTAVLSAIQFGQGFDLVSSGAITVASLAVAGSLLERILRKVK